MAVATPEVTSNGVSEWSRRHNGKQLLGRVEPAFRDLVKEALDQGALLRAGHGRHPMSVVCPDGERLTLSQSTSDWRARKNAQAFLNRHGLEVGPRQRPKAKRPGYIPGNAKAAHRRAEAWLAMQAEDREFTAYDFASDMGLEKVTHAMATYLKPWLASGKVHLVRYTRNPGQRGLGTKVFTRQRPLAGGQESWDAVMKVLTPKALPPEATATPLTCPVCGEPVTANHTVLNPNAALGEWRCANTVEPLPAAAVPVELNGHATATEAPVAAPEPSLRAQMWRHVSDGLFSLAQAAEVAARLEG